MLGLVHSFGNRLAVGRSEDALRAKGAPTIVRDAQSGLALQANATERPLRRRHLGHDGRSSARLPDRRGLWPRWEPQPGPSRNLYDILQLHEYVEISIIFLSFFERYVAILDDVGHLAQGGPYLFNLRSIRVQSGCCTPNYTLLYAPIH
jgi:hypothetical protein